MGVFDKIKNALFEVEYVEVEEKPKKDKKNKPKGKSLDDDRADKPIAKKIVLPGKKEEKVEEIQEEELKDENFEVRPKDETVKEVFSDDFKVMDDDFYIGDQPVVHEEKSMVDISNLTVGSAEVFAPPEIISSQPVQVTSNPDKDYVREYDSYKEKVSSTLQNDYHIKERESKPYGMDLSHQVSIKEYGTENKEERGYFKPSPIISPIYGILDKNYKKEDVVSKREIRITSSYSRTNVNVDDIRNKAYGRRGEQPVKDVNLEPQVVDTPSFEVEEEKDNLLVDLSDEKKPEVKEITVGDAIEYFQDLGLEYNVDYVDASKKTVPKPKTDNLENDIEKNMEAPVISPVAPVIEENKKKESTNISTPVVEVVDEGKKSTPPTLDDDDNLFDLIDSMYKEENK